MAYDPDHDRAPPIADESGVSRGESRGRSTFDAFRAPVQRVGGVLPRSQVLWALVILAMLLDVALTGVGLSLGLQERNPVALVFIDSIGLLRAAVVLKGSVLGVGVANWLLLPRLFPTQRHRRYLIPLALALPWWVAVWLNAALVLSVW